MFQILGSGVPILRDITVRCLNFGTPKIINFPFGTNGKLIILGVPILTHTSTLRYGMIWLFCVKYLS